MSIELLFGRSGLDLELPPDAQPTIIRKQAMPKLADPSESVRQAFQQPVAALPLAELARGRQSACIVICDITRPVPNHLFLRPLVEQLLAAGIPADAITILVACGLHRPNLGSELAELVGDDQVMEQIRIVNHDARDDANLVDLGQTELGTPVQLNRYLVEADLRIVSGLVEPHFMAGWSGGRKVVSPGVAGQRTIRTFHSARFMEHPATLPCQLEGNLLHHEQLAIIERLGECYAINTVLDEERDLIYVNFGEVVASHLAAVDYAAPATQVEVGRRFPTVVTSSAGYPLDKTYYQVVKAMVTPIEILEEGGTLIVAAQCSEGLGSADYRDSQRRLTELGPAGFLALVEAKAEADIDEWETEMQLKPMKVGRIQLYSPDLSAADQALTGVEIIDDLEQAIAEAIGRSGDPNVAIIPEGPYVIPRHRP